MVTLASNPLMQKLETVQHWLNVKRKPLVLIILLAIIGFGYFKPQQLADIWLTRNQQGAILFKLERYQQAASTFNSTRWQAYSLYGAEQYDQSAILYSQFTTIEDALARGNAFAQARRYVKARAVYQQILSQNPDYQPAQVNFKIVQTIIEDVNRMSESQKAEKGDSPKDLGDEPQTGEGADKKEGRKQEQVILTAEQLLMDQNLSNMWLRQVQKDPALFLAQKFNMQQKRAEEKVTISKGADNEK